MKKHTLLFVIAGLLTLAGCGNDSMVRNAYVYPDGACGYRVRIGNTSVKDTDISRCLPLEKATNLADKINKDMGKDWAYYEYNRDAQ